MRNLFAHEPCSGNFTLFLSADYQITRFSRSRAHDMVQAISERRVGRKREREPNLQEHVHDRWQKPTMHCAWKLSNHNQNFVKWKLDNWSPISRHAKRANRKMFPGGLAPNLAFLIFPPWLWLMLLLSCPGQLDFFAWGRGHSGGHVCFLLFSASYKMGAKNIAL